MNVKACVLYCMHVLCIIFVIFPRCSFYFLPLRGDNHVLNSVKKYPTIKDTGLHGTFPFFG